MILSSVSEEKADRKGNGISRSLFRFIITNYTPNLVVRTGTPTPMVEATVTERR